MTDRPEGESQANSSPPPVPPHLLEQQERARAEEARGAAASVAGGGPSREGNEPPPVRREVFEAGARGAESGAAKGEQDPVEELKDLGWKAKGFLGAVLKSDEFRELKSKVGSVAKQAGEKGKEVARELTKGESAQKGRLKAKEVWEAARTRVQAKGGHEAADYPDRIGQLKELMAIGKENASQMSDSAAAKIAGIYQKATGRETSPERVKAIALRVGVAAVVTMVISAILGSPSGGGGLLTDAIAEGVGTDGFEGFGDSFEGEMHGFFANKGGLDIRTDVVDMDGCILDMG